MDILQSLFDPFIRYEFMRNALLGIVFVGVVCTPIGVYVVLRRMAFIGDALAHTVLPGIVMAYLNGLNLFIGALAAGLLTALGIGWLSRREMLREDTAIGIMFTGMFALGILLMGTIRSFRDFTHILFGNILFVTPSTLGMMAVVAVITLTLLVLFHKELELTSFDPTHAAVIGVRVDVLRYGLLFLLALSVVTAIQAVGVVLTSALLVTPAATASLLTNRLPRMMVYATMIAILCGFAGLYTSYRLSLDYAINVPTGAAIVIACTLAFALVWAGRAVWRIKRARAVASSFTT
jgi:manganese/iron transport system permease protein